VGQVWQLYRGQELLAEITVDRTDMPWLIGGIATRPGFEAIRPAFEREVAIVDAEGDLDYEAWQEAYEPISRLTLVSPAGPAADFLLHVRGEEAWFRWSDEPLDDQ